MSEATVSQAAAEHGGPRLVNRIMVVCVRFVMQPDAVGLVEDAQRLGCIHTELVVWLLLLSPRLVGAVDLLHTAPEQAQQHVCMELDPVPPHATQLLIAPGMRAASQTALQDDGPEIAALGSEGVEAEIKRRHARAEEREGTCALAGLSCFSARVRTSRRASCAACAVAAVRDAPAQHLQQGSSNFGDQRQHVGQRG